MLLQIIHHKNAPTRASSIYCRWIRRDQGVDLPLVAIWFDSEMRCFEREFALNSEPELLTEGALDEPDGASAFQRLKQPMTFEISVHHS